MAKKRLVYFAAWAISICLTLHLKSVDKLLIIKLIIRKFNSPNNREYTELFISFNNAGINTLNLNWNKAELFDYLTIQTL